MSTKSKSIKKPGAAPAPAGTPAPAPKAGPGWPAPKGGAKFRNSVHDRKLTGRGAARGR